MTLVPVTGAAIVEMIDANRRQTVCATDDVSEALEPPPFTLVKGPCVQAMSTGRPVLVSDLHEVGHPHWPMFAQAASRTPARAHFSFPLQIGVISMGVLDLYRDQPGPLSAAELAGVLLCADLAFWALLGLRAGTDADRTVPWQWGLDRPIIAPYADCVVELTAGESLRGSRFNFSCTHVCGAGHGTMYGARLFRHACRIVSSATGESVRNTTTLRAKPSASSGQGTAATEAQSAARRTSSSISCSSTR